MNPKYKPVMPACGENRCYYAGKCLCTDELLRIAGDIGNKTFGKTTETELKAMPLTLGDLERKMKEYNINNVQVFTSKVPPGQVTVKFYGLSQIYTGVGLSLEDAVRSGLENLAFMRKGGK